MSLQWLAIAGILYIEVAVTSILLLPFVNASRWKRFFSSDLVKSVSYYTNYVFSVCLVLIVICFIDAVREMGKYQYSDAEAKLLTNQASQVDNVKTKLFRAQRNVYITGFSLFLWFVIWRLVVLLRAKADMQQRAEALLADNQALTQEIERLKASKSKSDKSDEDSDRLECGDMGPEKQQLREDTGEMDEDSEAVGDKKTD